MVIGIDSDGDENYGADNQILFVYFSFCRILPITATVHNILPNFRQHNIFAR